MRISDWSSDVCSSALIARERFGGVPVVRQAIRHELELFVRELATDLARLPGLDAWSAEDLSSEERRVGKECFMTGSFRWCPDHYQNTCKIIEHTKCMLYKQLVGFERIRG